MTSNTILVLGGLGFIGKHFIKHFLSAEHTIINIDGYSYAADRNASKELSNYSNYVESREYIHNINYLPICDYIINFAAESHVDNSISDSSPFIHTNISGTHRILELLRKMDESHRPHYIHISTDEVYGTSEASYKFCETDVLKPSSPYSASKAAADQLVIAYGKTYDLNYTIIRPTNCYGHNQYPEKLIPTICMSLLKNKQIPVHGDGSYIRTWLHVQDAVEAIAVIMYSKNNNKEIYNISGPNRLSVLDVIQLFTKDSNSIKFIANRKGQDLNYNVDDNKLRKLGWRPTRNIEETSSGILNKLNPNRFVTRN